MDHHRVTTGILVALLWAGAAASAQSLADVARAEEARRKAMKLPVKVYGNDDLRPGVEPPPPPPSAQGPAAKPAGSTGTAANSKPATPAKPGETATAGAATGAAAASAAPAAAGGVKDEAYWRTRISEARTAIQRNQVFLDALQSQINGLYAEFVAKSDPAQRALVEQKRLKAIAEQDRIKGEIATQTKAIQTIEDEARRAGVPAGWLR